LMERCANVDGNSCHHSVINRTRKMGLCFHVCPAPRVPLCESSRVRRAEIFVSSENLELSLEGAGSCSITREDTQQEFAEERNCIFYWKRYFLALFKA
jgi:hypothetical protein